MNIPRSDSNWSNKKTSQIMLDFDDLNQNSEVSLGEMLKYMRGRAFGMALVLMALLSLIPNLFGHAILTGLLMVILSAQMLLGFKHIRLPQKALNMSFSKDKIKNIMEATSPKIAKIEKLLKPRLIFITEDIGKRLIGAVILPLSVLIMLPFPLTNFWPALSILVLALGLIEKDGIAVIIGFVMSLSAVWIVVLIAERLFS